MVSSISILSPEQVLHSAQKEGVVKLISFGFTKIILQTISMFCDMVTSLWRHHHNGGKRHLSHGSRALTRRCLPTVRSVFD